MNRTGNSRMAVVFWGVLAIVWSGDAVAQADFTFGEPVNLGPNINSPYGDWIDCFSSDGLEMYYSGFRVGTYGGGDIWVATRKTIDDDWGTLVNLGPPVNTGQDDVFAYLSADGLELYFTSNRPGGYGTYDIWATRRATRDEAWGIPENLGPLVNSSNMEVAPWLSSDGLGLYFAAHDRAGGYGGADIWIARRATKEDPWGEPTNLGPIVNSSAHDTYPYLSPDGLLLFFSGERIAPFRPGGFGGSDMWVSRRASLSDPWGTPINLGPVVNSSSRDGGPTLSPDGSMLYFWSERPGGFGGTLYGDIYQAAVIPIVDFNADGKVDAEDMALFEVNWGKNTTLCDIGPLAWGDGVVDEKDLGVLMESMMMPGPRSLDVSCDVVLSWISPSFAESHDVYFATSLEAVSNADRANPLDVLVSQGQAETTYDPEGLLELNQTYYWRVDAVIESGAVAVYRGPILKFTTEASHRIRTITATASSAVAGMGPDKTVDGSGLDANGGHSTDRNAMWLGMGVPQWIQYEFDRIYTLDELWVWNSNQTVEAALGFGARNVTIKYSTDGTAWTSLEGVPEFVQASGQPGYLANTKMGFGGVEAKYVKLTIEKAWGSLPSVGLSEVQFFYIPATGATQP